MLSTHRVVTALNLLGVDVVANASNVFALCVISPFAALTIAGLPRLKPQAWLIGPPPTADGTLGVHWGAFLSVLLWNTSGYDSVGALAAEARLAPPCPSQPRASRPPLPSPRACPDPVISPALRHHP
jgi:amino acid transporter